jgi:AraC-like DNA-binding protein
MTVPAIKANELARSATGGIATGRAVFRTGSYPYDGPDVVSGWHQHEQHQVEYAFVGVVEVETAAGHYFLPPQQAIWIPAGLAHNTTLRAVRTVSIFFDPELVTDPYGRAQVLPVPPAIREMIIYAARWPLSRTEADPVADDFFAALAGLIGASLVAGGEPFFLPISSDPLLTAAMEHTRDHLAGLQLAGLCRAIGTSERTLRRRFVAEVGMSWRSYLLQARLVRAAALLSESSLTVLEIATAVGFDSGSAFSRAFARHAGSSPREYRSRTAASVREHLTL